MFHLFTDDTICAICTSPGMGALAVIRLAGPEALRIADEVFTTPSGRHLADAHGGTHHFGIIADDSTDIDEVVAIIFRKPHSFTGDDIVEFSCHGSVVIQNDIMQLLIRHGARTARPGEFSRRAFVNGKMDLSQTEAVADLIASQNNAARRIALNQMRGGFSTELRQLREQLLHFTSLLELELDFSEENVEFADRRQMLELIARIDTLVTRLSSSFRLGNAIKNGIPVAIVGPTNAGKSTLLNTLLHDQRAIVSDIHGTTRDTIEDTAQIDGLTFRFIDTAGLRTTDDTIEALGIDRSYQKIASASIVILMLDVCTATSEAIDIVNDIRARINPDEQKIIVAINKTDLDAQLSESLIHDIQRLCPQIYAVIGISAQKEIGIDRLTELLTQFAGTEAADTDQTIVTNLRHYEALVRTHDALVRTDKGLRENLSGELVALDVREAIEALGEITGEITNDEVLGNIFSHFCIGK